MTTQLPINITMDMPINSTGSIYKAPPSTVYVPDVVPGSGGGYGGGSGAKSQGSNNKIIIGIAIVAAAALIYWFVYKKMK